MQDFATKPTKPFRQTAASQILSDLRRMILEMCLLPGVPLLEKDLTERYGVSRTPVREALLKLGEEGLVDIFPQSGTFVGRIPVASLPDAVAVRQALELFAIEKATLKADAATIARLNGLIDRQAAMLHLNDQAGFHRSDEAFHETIATIADHPALWRVAQQAKTQIDRCRRLTLPVKGRMAHVIGEHKAIVKAIAGKDVHGARAAMTTHLTAVLPDVETLKITHPTFFC